MQDSRLSTRFPIKATCYVLVAMLSSPWLGAAPFATAQSSGADASVFAYVGTFSAPLTDVLPTQVDLPPGNGKGIHVFRVDTGTGDFIPASVFRMGTSPSFVLANAKGDRLYSTNETDRFEETKQGTVSAFSIDPASGQLSLINTVASGGAGPTHASMHASGKFLFVANYFGGSIAVLPVHEDGSLGSATDIKIDEGPIGPTEATNAPPGSYAISGHDRTHAHMIHPDPSGRFVLHTDLGLDRIYIWKFDAIAGTLSPADQPYVSLPPGDGPRYFTFHPNGKWLYSIQEEGSTLTLFDFDNQTGRLTSRQTVSTLPKGFAGSNFCSGVAVSQDGRFVYAGNRLYDSIAVFRIGSHGELERISEAWTRGDYPRSFQFSTDGRFLYSCNQRADNIAIFRVDSNSGKLAFSGQFVPVGNPSSISFVEVPSRVSK